jgi:competence protein ComFC
MKVKSTISALIDLLFPPHCIFCGAVIPSGTQICEKCEEEISNIDAVKYMNVPEAGKTILCVVPYSYSGQVRQSIIRFKFQGQKQFASFYGEKMGEQIQKSELNLDFDAITSVPISAQRRKSRGYNQSELIARVVANRMGLPYREYLMKITDNKEQHKLSQKERQKNVRGVYQPLQQEEMIGKNILLIDDIVTTGATLSECALVLFQSGANEVNCAAIAQVVVNQL